MLAQTDFALNPVILENVRMIVDVHVVTYQRDGHVLASTLPTSLDQEFLRLMQAPDVTECVLSAGGRFIHRDLQYLGMSYTIAYRPLHARSDTLLAFVVGTAHIAQAQ